MNVRKVKTEKKLTNKEEGSKNATTLSRGGKKNGTNDALGSALSGHAFSSL